MSLDDLAQRLSHLRALRGNPSYAELARRITELRGVRGDAPGFRRPGRITVYDCFRTGRSRVDIDLVADIVEVLGEHESVGRWREAYAALEFEAGSASVAAVKSSIPPSSSNFVGRRPELTALMGTLGGLSYVAGPPGVGKTELVLAAASGLLPSFERHAFVSLRGFDPALRPVSWRAVLAGLVRALNPEAAQDADVDTRTLALNELARARRTLVVLDDARDMTQIEPLLPALAGARVLVTSRHRANLPDGKELLLDCLSVDEAVRYLGSIDRTLSEPANRVEAERIAAACDCLPLRLSLAAASCVERPDWKPHDRRLRVQNLPIDEGVRRSVAASFTAIESELDYTLRVLALHPAGELTVRAASAVTGQPEPVARDHLARLSAACLVRISGPDRFRLHDLVRSEALRRGEDLDAPSARTDALSRLVEHYSTQARRKIHNVLGPGVVTPEGSAAAASWLLDEVDGALALAAHLYEAGRHDDVAAIAETWAIWLEYDNRYADAESLLQSVLRCPESPGRHFSAMRLSRLYANSGRANEGLAWASYAVALAPEDWVALTHMGQVQRNTDQVLGSFATLTRAVRLAHQSGDRLWVGRISCNLASTSFDLGRWSSVPEFEQQAAAIAAELGDVLCLGFLRRDRTRRAMALTNWPDFAQQLAALREYQVAHRFTMPPTILSLMEATSLLGQGRGDDADHMLSAVEPEFASEELGSALLRARIALDRGDDLAARAALRRAERLADRVKAPVFDVDLHWVRGLVNLRFRRIAAARRELRLAVRLGTELGLAIETSRAQVALGACLYVGGNAEAGQRQLDRATHRMAGSGLVDFWAFAGVEAPEGLPAKWTETTKLACQTPQLQ